MPPKKIIDSTVYIVDCSENPASKLKYLFKIFASKYFAQTKSSGEDLQKVIYFNAPKSKPVQIITEWRSYHLDNLSSFPHDFDDIDVSQKPTSIFEALDTAVKCFADEFIDTCYIKKIVFITELNSPMVCDDDTWIFIEDLKNGLKKYDIWLYVVGASVEMPSIKYENDVLKLRKMITPSPKATENQENNLKVLQDIFEDVNGIVANYEIGFDLFFSYKPEGKMPFTSYVDMSIGNHLKIAVAVSKSTRDREMVKFSQVALDDAEDNDDFTWIDMNRMEEVGQEDVITGYAYHNKHVFFNPGQEENMDKNEYFKCLSIFSFCDAKEISTELFILPDSIHVISADTRTDEDAIVPLQKLITGMRIQNKVALAIRIYNNGNCPNLFCIFPCPEHDSADSSCLLMGELPYAHCIKHDFKLGGKVEKIETNAEEKMCAYGYFEAMNIENLNNGNDIIPEYMRMNRSILCKYMYFVSTNLDQTPETPSELTVHPILAKLREEYVEMAAKLWPEMDQIKAEEEVKDEDVDDDEEEQYNF